MKDKLKGAVITAVAIAALALGGAAIAGAAGGGGDNKTDKPVAGAARGGDDNKTEKPITGQALDRAKAVALDHTGGGKVTGSEIGDEEGAYEVEVTRADGSQVDVHLDKGFNVINQSADGHKGENESGNTD
jgi:uncharacterized membrane protein YkoI